MRKLVLVAMATALVAVPLTVVASHQFTDVPDSNIFHDDIAWMADNGITKGCNPPANDQYCPDRELIRGEEAAFFHRYDGYLRDSLDPRLLPTDCEDGQVAEFDGETWQCADSSGLTAVSGDVATVGAGETADLTVSCDEGQVAVSGGVSPDDDLLDVDLGLSDGDATLAVTNTSPDAVDVTPYAICTDV